MEPELFDESLLFAYELRIARRADELAQSVVMRGLDSLEIWSEAERQTTGELGVVRELLTAPVPDAVEV